MTKSERTKKYIIEAAAPVFNKKGYAGTSLSDLIDATGLTKGSIYGNFTNKEEIAVNAFKFAISKIRDSVRNKVDSKPTYLEKIYSLLEFFQEYVFNTPIPGGCILLNTAVEADDNQPVLKEQVAQELYNSVNHITYLLEKAIETGALKEEFDPRSLAYNIFCAVEGAIMMSRVQASIKPMQEVITFWKQQIKQLEIN
jgi:AcrR family transcriptional regulator